MEAICQGNERIVSETIDHQNCIFVRHPVTLATVIHLSVIHNHSYILQLFLSRQPIGLINSQDIVSIINIINNLICYI